MKRLLQKILISAVFLISFGFSFSAYASSAYEGLAVANVKSEPLNMRAKPSMDGKIIAVCYRGAGGTVLERTNGWSKVRSGKLEGWMKDDYLLFGADIEPLAKELGLLSAKVTAETLNIRKEPSTSSAILDQAAEGKSYPLLSQSDGWVKIQLDADTEGYAFSDYVSLVSTPGLAVDIEEEAAAVKEAGGSSATDFYVIPATEEELYLMAACTEMETGDGSYEAKLAVASCIVNRVKKGEWGKSITSVIYAKGQFPGATSGLLDRYLSKTPSKTALKAAKDALNGSNNIGDYLYFRSAKSASTSSFSSYKIVGGNCFY